MFLQIFYIKTESVYKNNKYSANKQRELSILAFCI